MKKYLKEMIILMIQIMLFYLFPFTAGPTDGMGMVLVLLFSTLILSVIFGTIAKGKVRIIYPFVVAIVFIPTVYIHYNYTALVYTVWYLIDSYLGVLIGSFIGKISSRRKWMKRFKKILNYLLIYWYYFSLSKFYCIFWCWSLGTCFYLLYITHLFLFFSVFFIKKLPSVTKERK